jgi:2-hydroxychromene-2-carboxylate isomerase
MSQPLDFYFDFSSPYGYIGAEKIDALAARYGRTVNWHPILLGAVFKVTGGQPLPLIPLKKDYARKDILRSARYYGIPLNTPSKFPIAGQAPSRAFYWAEEKDPAAAKRLALALYRAFFIDDRDISSPDVAAEVAAAQGYSRAEVLAAIGAGPLKERLRKETEDAIALGVFGSPYIIVDGEPFWGVDRLEHLERWLAKGPF